MVPTTAQNTTTIWPRDGSVPSSSTWPAGFVALVLVAGAFSALFFVWLQLKLGGESA